MTFSTNRGLPVVITKEKEAYQYWQVLHRNFPKVERFGLGQKIDSVFLNLLELTYATSYLPPEQKIVGLGKVIPRLDILKFFIQLAWENKCIHTDKYTELSQKLDEIGRMLGGWKKGLLQKTPTPNNR
ncbi:MAG: four helix bundle protein [Patescibacteria group bacterium]|jgi:hypothetical protein